MNVSSNEDMHGTDR